MIKSNRLKLWPSSRTSSNLENRDSIFESVCRSLIVESQVLHNLVLKNKMSSNCTTFLIWCIDSMWLMQLLSVQLLGAFVWDASSTCQRISHTATDRLVSLNVRSQQNITTLVCIISRNCWSTKIGVKMHPGVAGAYVICLVMRSRSATAWVSCFLRADFGSLTAEIKSCTWNQVTQCGTSWIRGFKKKR